MRESKIQTQIINFLRSKGAFVVNIPGSAYLSGIPDLLFCYRGLFIALEVKRNEEEVLRPGQKVNMALIKKAKGLAYKVISLEEVKIIIDDIKKTRF